MEMTEQGKAMAEVTFTITESTSSGNSYLKYCGEKGPVAATVATLPSWVQTPPVTGRASCPHLRLGSRGIEAEPFIGPAGSTGKVRVARGAHSPRSPHRQQAGKGTGAQGSPHRSTKFSTRVTRSW